MICKIKTILVNHSCIFSVGQALGNDLLRSTEKSCCFKQSALLSLMWINFSNQRWVGVYGKTDNIHSLVYQFSRMLSLQVNLLTLGWLSCCCVKWWLFLWLVVRLFNCVQTICLCPLALPTEMKHLQKCSRLILNFELSLFHMDHAISLLKLV